MTHLCYLLALGFALLALVLWLPVAYQAIRGGEDLRHADDWTKEGGMRR